MNKSVMLFLLSVVASFPQKNVDASSDISTYIINGGSATTGDWPSIATLYYDAIEYTGLYGLYCGASILDSEHVLTAAHCLYDGNGALNEEYLVYTSIAVQMENESQFTDGSIEIIRAAEFYVHDDYDDSSYSDEASWPNDIAIIKLAESMNIDSTDYVSRASQSNADDYRKDNIEFIAVGHGYTETGDEEELLQTTLNYEPGDECDLGVISDSQLCMTGALNDDTGYRNSTCSGDSGGPLYWYDADIDEYVQAGITSYGWTNCYYASSDDTSVFTEVADYDEWIQNVIDGIETPAFTVTEDERDAYDPETVSSEENSEAEASLSSSSSSGGSVGIWGLLLIPIIIRLRARLL